MNNIRTEAAIERCFGLVNEDLDKIWQDSGGMLGNNLVPNWAEKIRSQSQTIDSEIP